MWRAISQALDWIYRLAAYLAGALLVLLCALVLYSIVARLAGLFAGGASDFAGYVMATSTFMALSYTFRTHGHIRVTLLIQTATGAVRRGIELLCLGFMSIATAYLAYYMCRLAWASYVFGDRSEGADAVLMWIPQSPVALGAVLFAVAVFHTFALALFDYESVDPESDTRGAPAEV